MHDKQCQIFVLLRHNSFDIKKKKHFSSLFWMYRHFLPYLDFFDNPLNNIKQIGWNRLFERKISVISNTRIKIAFQKYLSWDKKLQMYNYTHSYGKDDSVAHNKKQQMQNAHKNCFTLTGIHNTQNQVKVHLK